MVKRGRCECRFSVLVGTRVRLGVLGNCLGTYEASTRIGNYLNDRRKEFLSKMSLKCPTLLSGTLLLHCRLYERLEENCTFYLIVCSMTWDVSILAGAIHFNCGVIGSPLLSGTTLLVWVGVRAGWLRLTTSDHCTFQPSHWRLAT